MGVRWGRITRNLKDLYVNNKDNVNNETHIILPQQGDIENDTGQCVNQPNTDGQGEALPVSDRDTCPRRSEGLEPYAGVAISARDISVGEMINDHHP